MPVDKGQDSGASKVGNLSPLNCVTKRKTKLVMIQVIGATEGTIFTSSIDKPAASVAHGILSFYDRNDQARIGGQIEGILYLTSTGYHVQLIGLIFGAQ